MKTRIFSKAALAVIMLLALSASTASAKSWRINNDTRKQANFTDINAAMASADVEAGDTLYLDPGCLLATTQTITKSVTVIGTGYFLQNGMVASTINAELWVNAAGAKLTGLSVNGAIVINENNITVERCKIDNQVRSYSGPRYGTSVIQCYIYYQGSNAIQGQFRNATIKNNIIRANYFSCQTAISDVHDSEISNNYLAVIWCDDYYKRDVVYNVTNSQIFNNIIKHGRYPDMAYANSSSDYNNSFYNNVISSSEGTYTNVSNIVWLGSADMSNVFAEGTDDAAYHLKEGSPAKGAAADGGDCGPYGGATPYVEGGKPLYHPFINDVTVSVKPVNGKIKLKLNAKMQNE